MKYLNFNTPSAELALKLINHHNNIDLKYSEVALTDAVSLPAGSVRNSTVTVTSIPHNVYYGNVAVEYDRYNLAEMIDEPVLYVTGPVYPLETAVATLNKYCGIALTPAELVLESYTEAGEATLAVGESLIYLEGNPFKIMDEFDHFKDRLWNFANNELPTASNQI